MKKRLKGLMGRTGRIGAVAVALLQLAGPALAASEMHAPQVFYRDVAVSAWAPTVTVSSITSTNGGAFAATGAWFYAVAAQSSLGKTTNGPVTNVTVTATGYYVRVTWPSYGGATNYLLYRGSTASNLTNYVAVAQQGVTNVYVDYGTNAWTVGTPSNSITTVPWLKLPSASYTPTGNDAVRASDIAGFDASNFYTRSQADAAFVNTNDTNSVTTQMIQDGTIVGADLAANAITPAAMGTNVAVSVTNFDGSVDSRYVNALGDTNLGPMVFNDGSGITILGGAAGPGTFSALSNRSELAVIYSLNSQTRVLHGAGIGNLFGGVLAASESTIDAGTAVGSIIWGNLTATGTNAAKLGSIVVGRKVRGTNNYVAVFGDDRFSYRDNSLSVYQADIDYLFNTNGLRINNQPVFDVSNRITVNVATNPGAPDGCALIKRQTNFSLEPVQLPITNAWSLFYGNGSTNLVPVSLGASGTVLISQGAGAAPVMAFPLARVTNAWSLFWSDGASNLIPLALGQAGAVPVSQGSNSPPLMQLPTATATNVAMSNLLDVAGTAWNTNFLLRFNGTAWQAVDQTNLTVGTALNANLLDGYDSSAFQLYLGAVTNNGGFLVGFTNGTYGWAPSLTASATNVIDSAVTVTHSATNYTASTNNAQAHLRGIDARLAVLAAGTGNASRIHSRAISTNAPSHGDVYQWDTNTASWIPAAASASGAWSSNIVFAGTTATNPCGLVITMAYSGTNSMQSTGCVAYLTIVDTNGPASVGGTATNYTVVFNSTTNTGAAIVLSTGGSITNVITANGQIVVQSKDDTGGGSTGGIAAVLSVGNNASNNGIAGLRFVNIVGSNAAPGILINRSSYTNLDTKWGYTTNATSFEIADSGGSDGAMHTVALAQDNQSQIVEFLGRRAAGNAGAISNLPDGYTELGKVSVTPYINTTFVQSAYVQFSTWTGRTGAADDGGQVEIGATPRGMTDGFVNRKAMIIGAANNSNEAYVGIGGDPIVPPGTFGSLLTVHGRSLTQAGVYICATNGGIYFGTSKSTPFERWFLTSEGTRLSLYNYGQTNYAFSIDLSNNAINFHGNTMSNGTWSGGGMPSSPWVSGTPGINYGTNVGIGITTPSVKLHVYGQSDDQIKIDGPNSANTTLFFAEGTTNKASWFWWGAQDRLALYMPQADTYAMQISTNGRVAMGNTTPDASAVLKINSTSGNNLLLNGTDGQPGIYFQNNGTYDMQFFRRTDGNYVMYYVPADRYVMQIVPTNGSISASGTVSAASGFIADSQVGISRTQTYKNASDVIRTNVFVDGLLISGPNDL